MNSEDDENEDEAGEIEDRRSKMRRRRDLLRDRPNDLFEVIGHRVLESQRTSGAGSILSI